MVPPSAGPGRGVRRRRTRRRDAAVRRRRRGCRPGLFRVDPRSESSISVSKLRVRLALTYVFLLHYTGPVSATAIFQTVRGLNAFLVGGIADDRCDAGL